MGCRRQAPSADRSYVVCRSLSGQLPSLHVTSLTAPFLCHSFLNSTTPFPATNCTEISVADPMSAAREEKQCRICFEGDDPELGRLIRPCLCKGTISVSVLHDSQGCLRRLHIISSAFHQHVHLKCLQRWRNTSTSRSAFYSCPQCGYKYHFARTRVVGIATNPGE